MATSHLRPVNRFTLGNVTIATHSAGSPPPRQVATIIPIFARSYSRCCFVMSHKPTCRRYAVVTFPRNVSRNPLLYEESLLPEK